MWEYFRHTSLHSKLRKFKPLQAVVRFGKEQSARLLRYYRVRVGRGLHQTLSLESQRDSITGLVDYRVIVPDELITITPDRLPVLQQQSVVKLEGDCVRTKNVVRLILQNAKIDMSTGVVITSDDKLLMERDDSLKQMKNNPTYGASVPAHLRFIAGNCAVIHHESYSNYYHWLIDYVPRIYPLQEYGEPINLLIPDTLPPKHLHILKLCLPSNLTLVTLSLHLHRWVQVEKLIHVPRMTRGHFPVMPAQYLSEHIRSILNAMNLPLDHERKHNIFIARRVKRRRLLNEPDVRKLLARYDFTAYELEDMSFEEQVRLFHSANVIFAAHGAGLANAIFSDKINVIELANITASPTYTLLTQMCGQRYDYILPQERSKYDEATSRHTHLYLNNLPISVDLAQLEAVLRRTLVTS